MKHVMDAIKLGNRQLSFGFADDNFRNQETVMSALNDRFEEQGQAVLDAFVESVKASHGLSDIAIVQCLFWLAEDLKIEFRLEDENRDPFSVLKILQASPDRPLTIIPAAQVDSIVFVDVKAFFQELTGPIGPINMVNMADHDDQHAFARRLIKMLNHWEKRLRTCLSQAQQPGFPGKDKIGACLDAIHGLMVKKDAFSLISAVHQNMARVDELSRQIQQIDGFYTRHLPFWRILVPSMKAFDQQREELRQSRPVAEALDQLEGIFRSSWPYDEADRAAVLYEIVKTLYDKIVQRKTEQTRKRKLAEVDRMIENMRSHLNHYQSGPDLRNEALYSLRQTAKQIAVAKTIAKIEQLTDTAEAFFDTMRDKAAQNST